MSRIDKALRRVGPAIESEGGVNAEQTPFSAAWTVTSGVAVETASETVMEPLLEAPAPVGVRGDAALRFSSQWRERLALAPDGDPALLEQFRRLAATLHQQRGVHGLRSVMVTSASPGDGKTLTAINLALVLAESYRFKVLLVDADLRRPSIQTVVDVGRGTGLSECLRAPVEQKLALIALTPNLTLLPAGQPIANSIEALTSPRMRQILDEAERRYDMVVLDAPPVGLTTDAKLLTEMVDGTLLVIRAGQSQYPVVVKAIEALGGQEAVLGVVLNGTDSKPGESYYQYSADVGGPGKG